MAQNRLCGTAAGSDHLFYMDSCVSIAFGLVATFVLATVFAAPAASASPIYESGMLGATGIASPQLKDGTVPATNVDESVFVGARFLVEKPVVTTRVGGHFAADPGGTFFGAIVALDGPTDFPNSRDLSSADTLGTTLLTFPDLSAEVFGDLALSLDQGWYALIFGSQLFSASGEGAALRNNTDIGEPLYIALGPNLGWINLTELSSTFTNHRFVVEGRVVPEPASVVLTSLAGCFASGCRRRIAKR